MGDDDFIIPEDYDDPQDAYDLQIKMCAQKVIACFQAVAKEIDSNEAWKLFDQFVRESRDKFKRKNIKGAHDYDFDIALLAAYDTAPKGKKTANTNELGALHLKSSEATQKRLRRLLKTRNDIQQHIDNFCAEETIARRKE